MAQFAVPDSNTADGSWIRAGGGTPDFSFIDEGAPGNGGSDQVGIGDDLA